MKNASRIMDTVGMVFNIIGLVLVLIGAILFGVVAFNQDLINKIAQDSSQTADFVKNIVLVYFIFLCVELVVEALVLVVAIKALKNLKEDNGRIASHVMLIVIGIVGFDIFYLLGGIFGVVAANQDK